MAYFVYMLSNRPDGTLYVGITSDLIRRVHEHKSKAVEGFSNRYNLDRLVYYEIHEAARNAIQREKNIKHWPRQWKANLIEETNPEWRVLYDDIVR